jgi:glycosyltransferase involved in cell wall biosynthesis
MSEVPPARSEQTLVSVIIPAYNAAPFLAEAIESVERQQYPRTEIVVVDDGSTDNTAEIATRFSSVRYIRQPNRGIAAARNAGVLAASGTLLAFLDADDLWVEGKLALQLEALESQSNMDIVAGRVEQFCEPNCERSNAEITDAGDAYTAGAMLIRKSDFLRVGMFNAALRVGEFVDWHSRAMNLGLREHRLDAVVLRRRIHGGNTTLRRQDSVGDYLSVLKAHLDRKRQTA